MSTALWSKQECCYDPKRSFLEMQQECEFLLSSKIGIIDQNNHRLGRI